VLEQKRKEIVKNKGKLIDEKQKNA